MHSAFTIHISHFPGALVLPSAGRTQEHAESWTVTCSPSPDFLTINVDLETEIHAGKGWAFKMDTSAPPGTCQVLNRVCCGTNLSIRLNPADLRTSLLWKVWNYKGTCCICTGRLYSPPQLPYPMAPALQHRLLSRHFFTRQAKCILRNPTFFLFTMYTMIHNHNLFLLSKSSVQTFFSSHFIPKEDVSLQLRVLGKGESQGQQVAAMSPEPGAPSQGCHRGRQYHHSLCCNTSPFPYHI